MGTTVRLDEALLAEAKASRSTTERRWELVAPPWLQLDVVAGAALPCRGQDQRRGRGVLSGDADRLVQRDLLGSRPPGAGSRQDLPELGVDVAFPDDAVPDGPGQVVGA